MQENEDSQTQKQTSSLKCVRLERSRATEDTNGKDADNYSERKEQRQEAKSHRRLAEHLILFLYIQ